MKVNKEDYIYNYEDGIIFPVDEIVLSKKTEHIWLWIMNGFDIMFDSGELLVRKVERVHNDNLLPKINKILGSCLWYMIC